MITLPQQLSQLLIALGKNEITPILVGGCVRDHLLGHPSNDYDIELYGVDAISILRKLTKEIAPLNEVGKCFGVFKLALKECSIDFSLPRTESKNGERHQDFEVRTYGNIDFATAAKRRDFTINAIGYNPLDQTFIDPYHGRHDLSKHLLKCVDPTTFIEDPLRVLRAMQFASRFELEYDAGLLSLCDSMISDGALENLPKERIFEEIKKLLLSPKPSIGLKFLRRIGGLPFFTPLDKYDDTPQDPSSHPEGNVWVHTLMALDYLAPRLIEPTRRKLTLMLAVLLHDCAKPFTTQIEQGIPSAPGHAAAGIEVAQRFLSKLTDDKSLIASVLPLIKHHGTPKKLYQNNSDKSSVLRLSTEAVIADLILVSEADAMGRSFTKEPPAIFPAGEWLHEQATALNVLTNPPKPLIMGKDLIRMGLTPSPSFKSLLNDAYEAQLNCLFSTKSEAFLWLNNTLGNTLVTQV